MRTSRSWALVISLILFSGPECQQARAQNPYALEFPAHTGAIVELAFSSDSKILATASMDSTVKLWDPITGKEFLTLQGHGKKSVTGMAFSPDGKFLATSGADATIKLWDPSNGKQLFALAENALCLAFSPDSSTLVSGGYGNLATLKDQIKLWDVATGKLKGSLSGHPATVNSMAFSRDGKRFASAGPRSDLKVWEVATSKEVFSPDALRNTSRVAFSSDGQLLAAASPGGVTVWDWAKQKNTGKFKGAGNIRDLAFTPDGKRLVTVGGGAIVTVWNVESGLPEFKLATAQVDFLGSVAVSSDGRIVVGGRKSQTPDHSVVLWNPLR